MMRGLSVISLVFLLILSGCGTDLVSDTRYDLILDLPEVRREFDLSVVDLSDPTDYSHLGSGWHVPGQDGLPITRFVWTSAKTAEVSFDVSVIEDKELIFTVRPYIAEDIPTGSLDLQFNDVSIGRVRLVDEWRTYRLIIPASNVVLGSKNTLTIKQAQIYRVSETMIYSDDQRFLGASYTYFVLQTRRTARPPGIYTLPQILGAKNFVWGGTQRHVIFDSSPASFTWRKKLPSKPVLSFGTGFVPDNYDVNGSNALFEVSLKDEAGTTHLLFSRSIPPPKRMLEMGWDEYEYDLSKFANQDVEITLSNPLIDSDHNAVVNNGSWLEPTIQNRHVPYNVIIIAGSDEFPPENPVSGSNHEKFAFMSKKTFSMDYSTADIRMFQGIPMDYLETLLNEGWATGYFYTGFSEVEAEEMLSRSLDAVIGFDESSQENCDKLYEESTNWVKRLNNKNFALIYNMSSQKQNTDSRIRSLDSLLEWLFAYHFERDSLIILFNADRTARGWLLTPGDLSQEQLEIADWDTLSSFVFQDVLKIRS